MSSGYNTQQTFIFAPPEDDAGAWNLDLERFQQQLEQDFAEVGVEHEEPSGLRGRPRLAFEIETETDEWVDGLVDTPFDGTGSVLLMNVSPQEAAPIAQWLRDRYVPAPDLVRFTSQLVLANGHHDVRPLPATGGTEEIAHALQQHIDDFNAG